MKTVCSLSFIILALAISNTRGYSDDVYFSAPLIQARFDQLIPTFYPTITPNFNRLQPTTRPLIYPGIPQVHITENLIHPTDQPLLIVN